MRRKVFAVGTLAVLIALTSAVPASAVLVTVDWNPANPSVAGLNAEAIFSWTPGTNVLTVTLTNTSSNTVGAPILHVGGNPANPLITDANSIQVLTGLGVALPGTLNINAGSSSAVIGASSHTLNVSPSNLGSGADVSHEWNAGQNWNDAPNLFGATVNLVDFVTAVAPGQGTQLPGTNVAGTENINGPQMGIVASSNIVPLGGLKGAVQDSTVFTLVLTNNLGSDASWLDSNVFFVFGSHDIIGTPNVAPEPTSLLLLGSGLIGVSSWGRKRFRAPQA